MSKRRAPKIRNMLYRMAKLELQPGDLIVLQTDLLLDNDQVTALRRNANQQFKPYRVVIMSGGLKLGALRKAKRK